MNLLTLVPRLPLLPLTGFIRIAEVIRDEAERELHDPAAVRRQLEAAEEARRSGELTDEELARVQAQAADRVVTARPPSGAAPAPGEGS
jgi:Gas vesicle protein G